MKKNTILFLLCIFAWINLYASSYSNDSIKLESFQKEMIECMTSLNDLMSNNSDSYLKNTYKSIKKVNDLAKEYYDITNDSTIYICSFLGEFTTAIVYMNHSQIDSAYIHSRRAYQLYEPYGKMFCTSDTTKQWSMMIFGNDGIYDIMRDWNLKHKNYEEAIRLSTIITDSCKALKADLEVVKSLLKQGEIYEQIGNYKKSLECQTEALEKRIAYSNFGESPFASQIYVGLFELLGRLAEKEKLLINKESIEWVYSDTDFLLFLNDFIQSHPIDFCEEEEKSGKPFWVNQLFNSLIQLSEKFGQYNTIMPIEEGYGDFIIRNYGKESTEYAEYLMMFCNLYNNYLNELDSDVEKEKYRNLAEDKKKQALEIWKSFFDNNPINSIALEYQNLEKVFASQKQKKQETTDEIARLHSILISYLNYMQYVYVSSLWLGEYDIAYNAMLNKINVEEDILQEPDANSYLCLGAIYESRMEFFNAEKCYDKSYSIAYEKKDTIIMAETNFRLYNIYAYFLNNQTKARKKIYDAYKLLTEYSFHSLKKAELLEEMAKLYKSIQDDVMAYRLISLSQLEKRHCGQELSDDDYLKKADYFCMPLINDSLLFIHIQEIADKKIISKQIQKASEILGIAYLIDDIEKGIHYYQKAAYIAHELNDSISEAKNTAEIGSILFLNKKYDDAFTYMQKAEKICPRLKYRGLLTLMAHLHNDSIVSIRLPLLYESTTTELKRKLLSTNAEGREMMVRLMPYDVLKSMTYYYPQLPVCADVAYNSTLLYKGLLLNTQKTISEYIANSNDNNLKEQYNKLQIARSKEGQEGSTFEKSIQSKMETSELEMTLLESLSKKKVLTDLEITWNKVCDKLKKNDVAIEFVEISKLELLDRSAICYGALIVRRDFEHPVFVELDSKNEIEKDINALLNSFNTGSRLTTTKWKTVSERLYKKIWGKLENYIHPGENVFFSADGLLHKTPIEFLSDSLGYYANEKYNMFRLSSTRELCKKRKEGISKAILYGGLLYDADTKGQEVDSLESFQQYDDSSTRTGWQYLPASEAEVDSISSQLSSKGISVIKRKGLDGTEESFKELSGLDLSIVHIATHGFYFPQEEVRYLDYYQSQIDISPMKRSGIMMTGGQTAWMGKKSIEQEHDGILTSEEISKIDLSNVSLVVLSACQTGLGDIDSGAEGVIGIQRAFKLAGAQSLLMSLWKVDDMTTSYMMQRFYSRMLSGDTKHNAFKTAQQDVRNKYPNPYYWAGFVMLD